MAKKNSSIAHITGPDDQRRGTHTPEYFHRNMQ
jgi:hypothetical protein